MTENNSSCLAQPSFEKCAAVASRNRDLWDDLEYWLFSRTPKGKHTKRTIRRTRAIPVCHDTQLTELNFLALHGSDSSVVGK